LGGRVCKQLCHGADENLDRRQASLVADDRLYRGRPRVDSVIFYPLAFLGVWSTEQVVTVMITNWLLKVGWEVVLTPVTYIVVGWLKRKEGVDLFDEDTDFSPFKTKV
jgi:hypothetical protein